jgi:DMSO/TMAO reductase YedYZ molybdopterin-dependent catalytic subunit
MDTNDRLIKTKLDWARKKRGVEAQEYSPGEDDRLPPGQHLVENWPVLDLGYKPDIALSEWKLTIGGLVTTAVTWTWEDWIAQPPFSSASDFHCVIESV